MRVQQFDEHVTPRIKHYTEDFDAARKMFDVSSHSL
jgi:hypothetical protein